MRRRQLVRTFVLDAIADDYENLEQITKHVTSLSVRCGMTIESSEILQALGDLIAADLAKAYRLSNETAKEIHGMPPSDQIGSPDLTTTGDVYFWVTQDGRRLQLSDYADWPFDGDNLLRSDWNPPES
jgi:aryl-alcohol dehydrogenase-like predicted oxidoreductase